MAFVDGSGYKIGAYKSFLNLGHLWQVALDICLLKKNLCLEEKGSELLGEYAGDLTGCIYAMWKCPALPRFKRLFGRFEQQIGRFGGMST
jgi:hypothetical protein